MGTLVFKNSKFYLDQYNLTGQLNKIGLTHDVDLKDETVFDCNTKKNIAGLPSVKLAHEGFFAALDGTTTLNHGIDGALFNSLGVSDAIFSVAPITGADGEVVYFSKGLNGMYTPNFQVGELGKISVTGESRGVPLVRGLVGMTGAKTATTMGTAYELGAVSATQKIYAALHVFSKTGTPTLDVIVESGTAVGMPVPTTRLTFSQQAGAAVEWQELAGAITDTWWRVKATIAGASPDITFAVVFGIANL